MSLLDEVLADMGRASLGDELVSATYDEFRDDGSPASRPNLRASVTRNGMLQVRTVLTTSSGDSSAAGVFLSPESPALPTDVVAPVRLGDLVRRVPTNTSAVSYVRELTPASLEGGASAVAEGASKPELEVDFEGGILPVDKIAVVAGLTQEILADVPLLRSFVDMRMVDMLRVREAKLMLDGDGSSPSFKGIRQTTGTQTQAFSTSINHTIALAIAKVEQAYGVVDSVVIDETSYWSGYESSPTFWTGLASQFRILRMSSTDTNGIGSAKALVGAFQTGAVIRERDTSVAMAEDHGTDFITNKIKLRSERREAFFVEVPRWFVDTTLA